MRAGAIDFVYGEESDRRQARDELRREQRLRTAMRSGWQELARKDLVFSRYLIEHVPSGNKFRVHRGEVDAVYSPVSAYYFSEAGDVVFLEAA